MSKVMLCIWWDQLGVFRRGIRTLPERWEKVVASDGQYFES
ncbi:hypothetical protein ALC53_11513 [Atta colombica]|uniref:Uncharacterized protein n=1 Tax=Atta colombica TaxID=520822 RepID=A0A195B0Q9_9HYME|nr:hypothetical protein ALC53_11513 [Atta colombica]